MTPAQMTPLGTNSPQTSTTFSRAVSSLMRLMNSMLPLRSTYSFVGSRSLRSFFSNSLNLPWITRHSCYHSFSLSLLEKLQSTHHLNQILSQAIINGRFTDPFVSSKLLLSFLCADLTSARILFSQISNPNIFAWNFMFRAYASSSLPWESITLYNFMRKNDVLPDKYTFPFILKACSRSRFLEKGLEIHGSSLKLGFEFDVFVQNSLISMYATCGVIENARMIFDLIPGVRDLVSWNSMISGYLQGEFCGEALELFGEMIGGISERPNELTAVSVITACSRIGDLDLGRKVHGFVIVNGFVQDVFVGSSLIDMYSKCGCIQYAQKVFDKLTDRNVVCWTSMIAGYMQLDLFKEAVQLFRDMLIENVMADEVTIACVASACGHLGALDQGKRVHTYCERNQIEMNLTVKNSLIDMYAKSGDISKALEIFHKLIKRDVFSWSVMISGLAMNGKSHEALELFSDMLLSSEVRPNDVTFVGVLSACSHGGLVKKGIYYFNLMNNAYNLIPRIEHYGCMVDLLGRANLLAEADNLIRAMPIEPDAVIWRSLLFSCKIHGNIEMAEFAAEQILKMEPRKCGAHILLSNTYAAASRWSDVKRLRKSMNVHSIHKQPGCSFVEINGLIHEFYVADCRHPQTDIIHETIISMHQLLQSEGYVPDTSDFLTKSWMEVD